MRQAKAFLVVCAGILCIVAAYHFGATSAKAQASSTLIVSAFAAGGAPMPMSGGAVTANGDVYVTGNWTSWTYLSNVFGNSGPAPAVQSMTIGQLKAKYATPAGK